MPQVTTVRGIIHAVCRTILLRTHRGHLPHETLALVDHLPIEVVASPSTSLVSPCRFFVTLWSYWLVQALA